MDYERRWAREWQMLADASRVMGIRLGQVRNEGSNFDEAQVSDHRQSKLDFSRSYSTY